MKVYEALASALATEGCETVFGLMGDGNLCLWGCLGNSDRTKIFSARNEAGAVAMADGYFRSTGRIGVATINHGPGLTQTGTSLVSAARNHSAIIVITAEVLPGDRNNLQDFDQRTFVETCGGRYHVVSNANNLAREVADAFYNAHLHRCPVVLAVSIELQETTLSGDWNYQPSSEYLPSPALVADDESLTAVVNALVKAQRPVVLAGRGAKLASAKPEIEKLAALVGALLATSLQAKGLFAGNEFDIGIAGAYACACGEELLAKADFVLAVGAELGYYSTLGGSLFPHATVARIDVAPPPAKLGLLPGLYIRGDAQKTVAAINELLGKRQIGNEGFRSAATRDVLQREPTRFERPSDGLDPRILMRNLSGRLPRDILITCGIAHFAAFPAMYLELPECADMHFSVNFGAVGQTLPIAIGFGVGQPERPHLVIEGDGSLFMNLQELDTVVRHGIPMVLIVWNDSGLGAEVHKLRKKGFNSDLARWRSLDFVALARGFGGDGVRLEDETDVGDAVTRGLESRGLYLIDARVSPTTMSDSYQKLHFGMANKAPRLGMAMPA